MMEPVDRQTFIIRAVRSLPDSWTVTVTGPFDQEESDNFLTKFSNFHTTSSSSSVTAVEEQAFETNLSAKQGNPLLPDGELIKKILQFFEGMKHNKIYSDFSAPSASIITWTVDLQS